jgi:PmbA protein
MLGSTKPRSERLTVVLDPWVSAQFLQVVGTTLSAEMVLKGRSLFAERLGEKVASPAFSLVDDPTDSRAFTATETDGEGLATRRNVLIEDGELKMFLHNVWTARKAELASTGSAIRSYASTPGVGIQAVSLLPGERDPIELIKGIDNGILIQSVTGLHSGVNPISGDFSTGAEGLRIRNGELSEPLREFTIGSTIQKMLKDIKEVGNDTDWLPMSSAGSTVVINELTVSGG